MRKTIFIFIFLVIVWSLNLRSQSASGAGAVSFNASGGELIGQFYGHRDFLQQFEIAKKIAELHDPTLLRQLEPLLTDEDRHVRGNAAFVFAASGDEHGFDVLYSILKDRTSDRPEGQGVPGGNWSVRAQILSDQYYTVHLIGLLKDSRAVTVLVPLLKDREISYKVAWALGEIGDRTTIPSLIDALNDPNPDVRVHSIFALEKLNAKEALTQLKALTQDSDAIHFDGLGTVGEAATAAIAKIYAKQ
jgi:HEAT repeat protein